MSRSIEWELEEAQLELERHHRDFLKIQGYAESIAAMCYHAGNADDEYLYGYILEIEDQIKKIRNIVGWADGRANKRPQSQG